ncbi:RimK domain protein ATP-grasp [Anaeromyxobacter sp. K]|uniref:MvdC/MvdD family ATP grasp protein n=1 Tax=Anaeromyxobacter sp. (strain K) TaxID=447217 RepID=UPI00015F85D2|nr:alpha-L-glutamate ligase [Anaeromyxobacter sp. K]ACG72982.1 RimK domain protein ATP-grasp [Anaeromyxobacter sp. K]
MILAITHAGDEHAPLVLRALEALGADATVLDLSDLPRRGRVVLGYGAGGGARELRLEGRPPIDATEITAVWWRRPQPHAAAPGLRPEDAAFATRQTGEAVMGLVASLRGARFINDPWRDAAAAHKPHQLAAAERAGLPVPRTLVTSDPDAARAFLDACGPDGAVHKVLAAGSAALWRPTRRVGRDDLARLASLPLAPVIFQERVPGVDVRVTVVGDQLFAADLDARDTVSPDDFRPVTHLCRVAACELPDAVAAGLRRLTADLGLVYGAADFRRRDDGSWAFLELNPSGQWGFVEERTGQPITSALARLLAGR